MPIVYSNSEEVYAYVKYFSEIVCPRTNEIAKKKKIWLRDTNNTVVYTTMAELNAHSQVRPSID